MIPSRDRILASAMKPPRLEEYRDCDVGMQFSRWPEASQSFTDNLTHLNFSWLDSQCVNPPLTRIRSNASCYWFSAKCQVQAFSRGSVKRTDQFFGYECNAIIDLPFLNYLCLLSTMIALSSPRVLLMHMLEGL